LHRAEQDEPGEDDHCDSLHEVQKSHDEIEAAQAVHFRCSPHEGEVAALFNFLLLYL